MNACCCKGEKGAGLSVVRGEAQRGCRTQNIPPVWAMLCARPSGQLTASWLLSVGGRQIGARACLPELLLLGCSGVYSMRSCLLKVNVWLQHPLAVTHWGTLADGSAGRRGARCTAVMAVDVPCCLATTCRAFEGADAKQGMPCHASITFNSWGCRTTAARPASIPRLWRWMA